MKNWTKAALFSTLALILGLWIGGGHLASGKEHGIKGWTKGKGWGWVWGKDDELGAFNAMSTKSVRAAASLVEQGKVYDLGVSYSRNSYKWPGHSPGEIISFRTPEGVKRQRDLEFTLPDKNPDRLGWHSCALFMNDNVATQIDGLGHITTGEDNHWYNGFKEEDWGGNWGVRKCSAEGIPPVVARAVMLDIAGLKKVDALPSNYGITVADIDAALAAQKVAINPGDVVFVRTGTLRYWGHDGADHEKIGKHDTAGVTIAAAKYLVENFGVIMIGSDTSGLEVNPAEPGSRSFVPVHSYLLVEQGVYIAEFHYLEDLARDKVYEFCYVGVTNKIHGSTAGFTMRPIALR